MAKEVRNFRTLLDGAYEGIALEERDDDAVVLVRTTAGRAGRGVGARRRGSEDRVDHEGERDHGDRDK